MSYISILKNIPGFFGQPAGIATIASLGLHGVLGLALPLFPANSKPTEKPPEKTVPLVTLTPEEQSRLPFMNQRQATPGVIAQMPLTNSTGLLLPPMPPPLSTSLGGGTVPPIGNYAISSIPRNQPANMRIGRLGDKTAAKVDSSQQAFIDKKGQPFTKYTNNRPLYDPSVVKIGDSIRNSQKLENSTRVTDNSPLPNIEPQKMASLPTNSTVNLQNPDTLTPKLYVPSVNASEPAQNSVNPLAPGSNNVSLRELNYGNQTTSPGVIRPGNQSPRPVNPYGTKPNLTAFGNNLGNQSVSGTPSSSNNLITFGNNLGNQSVTGKPSSSNNPIAVGNNFGNQSLTGKPLRGSDALNIDSGNQYLELTKRYPNHLSPEIIRKQIPNSAGVVGTIGGNLVVDADGKVIDFKPSGNPPLTLSAAAKTYFRGYFSKEASGRVRVQRFLFTYVPGTNIPITQSTPPTGTWNQKLSPTKPNNQTQSFNSTTTQQPVTTSTGKMTPTGSSNNLGQPLKEGQNSQANSQSSPIPVSSNPSKTSANRLQNLMRKLLGQK